MHNPINCATALFPLTSRSGRRLTRQASRRQSSTITLLISILQYKNPNLEVFWFLKWWRRCHWSRQRGVVTYQLSILCLFFYSEFGTCMLPKWNIISLCRDIGTWCRYCQVYNKSVNMYKTPDQQRYAYNKSPIYYLQLRAHAILSAK